VPVSTRQQSAKMDDGIKQLMEMMKLMQTSQDHQLEEMIAIQDSNFEEIIASQEEIKIN